MKLHQRFFILGSGLFTFFCFCLPWEDSRSGFWLCATDGSGIVITALIASLVIIGSILIWHSRILILISSIIGILIVLPGHLSNLRYIEYGASLTAVGFFLTIAGVRFFPKVKDNTESIDEQDDEVDPQGEEE